MIVPGVDTELLYTKVVTVYESVLNQYSYKVFAINNTERVYCIQDTAIVYLGLVNLSYSDNIENTIVFEELINNESFSFNASEFKRMFSGNEPLAIEYYKFHGIWAEPLREVDSIKYKCVKNYHDLVDMAGSHYFVESRAKYVDEILPELKLKERYDNWVGYLFFYIFYELKENEKVGYAEYCTSNPHIHKIARDRVKEIGTRGLEYTYALKQCKDPIKTRRFLVLRFGPGAMIRAGVNCDSTMIELLEARYRKALIQKPDSRKKGAKRWFEFENKDIQYFYIPRYSKSNDHQTLSAIGTALFDEVHNGKYADLERFDYFETENRWKSEQLVFELASKAYKNYKVIYQHRPSFLRTSHGQMSYDVFICGLNVAIEYQGKQHFEPVEIFGGETSYISQKARDELKRQLSMKNNIKLVYINYWEDISIRLIREKVNQLKLPTCDTAKNVTEISALKAKTA